MVKRRFVCSKSLFFCLCLLATVMLTGCQKEDDPVEITGVSLDKSSLSLFIGDKSWLSAYLEPSGADYNSLVWSSSNKNVATVDSEGEVSAIAAGETVITVATKDGRHTASCAVLVKRMLSFEELVAHCNRLLDDAIYAYRQIDNDYSSYTSRLSLTHVTPALWDYWQNSYTAIDACNELLERIDGDYGMVGASEEEKDRCRGVYLGYRALVNYYMSVMFGNIPLVPIVEASWREQPGCVAQEMDDFVRAGFEEALMRLGRGEQASLVFGLMNASSAMKSGDYPRAAYDLEVIVDGIRLTVGEANLYQAQAYLLAAEACLQTGQAAKATEYVNILLQFRGEQPVSQSSVLATVKTLFNSYDQGMKYLNADRWGETAIWGYRSILPIPQNALNENSMLTQNTGW
jgi:Bacterial surface proteins containing Ig-like domains